MNTVGTWKGRLSCLFFASRHDLGSQELRSFATDIFTVLTDITGGEYTKPLWHLCSR